MRIALIGTRGVPARYGGFETCVEEVGRRLVERGHEVVVYCRTADDETETPPDTYLGMELVHLPALRKKSLETLSHTALSVRHLRRNRVDAAIVFNAANAPFLPSIRRMGIPVVTHVDGLEWKRTKWQGAGRRFYRLAESLAVRWSDALIADAQGIQDYYTETFGAQTELIAYGAPIIEDDADNDLLDEVDVHPGKYHLVVARFEPENHVDVIVEGYCASDAQLPLVVVGSAPYSDAYTDKVHGLADSRVKFLGGVWNQDLLNQLYANSLTYLHGHSVGGTNPSLLRAIGAGACTIAFDVNFNREVVGVAGHFFSSADDVARHVTAAENEPARAHDLGGLLRERARYYDWDDVAAKYERLCLTVKPVKGRRSRPTGRRARTEAAGAYER